MKINFRVRIFPVREIPFSADQLVSALLNLPKEDHLCLLDSCAAGHPSSHLLIAGIKPVEILSVSQKRADDSLRILDEKLAAENLFAIFTISYDFGLKLARINPRRKEFIGFAEPDVFLALFDCLILHNYQTGKTFLVGEREKFDDILAAVRNAAGRATDQVETTVRSKISFNFTKKSYLEAIENVKEYIRRGDTYQTNLTQQIRARLPKKLTPEQIFRNLRKNHPAPFAAFIRRETDTVISASPERFFKIREFSGQRGRTAGARIITTSPIKGTRPRGKNASEDRRLRQDLLDSEKDRAENVMIVDLLRNDIGRFCRFGTVEVEKLCALEEHPTLFHLVSTIRGEFDDQISFGDILKAVFPCGSITGAPKIRTMQIIDEIETAPRGLSMGALGYSILSFKSGTSDGTCDFLFSQFPALSAVDLSVAIRTMVIRGREAIFNVGGGIVIDSLPEDEYLETLTKAKALLSAIQSDFL